MKTNVEFSKSFLKKSFTHFACGLASLALVFHANAAASYEWDTELTFLDLNGDNLLLPLGPNWGPMLVDVHLGESAGHSSLGKAFASPIGGDEFSVQSFFDIFFDITITDVDPVSDFGGLLPNGSILSFTGNGPTHVENSYQATADPGAPDNGLIPPPESAPLLGFANVVLPLAADFNGNGENDIIKITLGSLAPQDENRTFIVLPGGAIINNLDIVMDIEGAVLDESQDPPFSIALTGPGSFTSQLVPQVPDGGNSLALLSGAMAGLLGIRRCWKQT